MRERLEHTQSTTHGSVFSYLVGFLLSIIITLAAYIPVYIHQTSTHEVFSLAFLIPFVLILAFVQLTVQLWFFLHIGKESGPRWNLAFFVSTFGLVLLVVIMSVWIMNHLNTNMTPADMTNFILHDEGIQTSASH
ncbi:MAG: cytochrome C oxidase subunit IV family protein [Patescibacteria group bacterium]|nr:cytochrome C oxidase subunit IV family protein [Patescibacteria group bacterium]MDE2589745.1 cytochrome C oxidase subunit IV family protein [Patescibacteria group bacterium]